MIKLRSSQYSIYFNLRPLISVSYFGTPTKLTRGCMNLFLKNKIIKIFIFSFTQLKLNTSLFKKINLLFKHKYCFRKNNFLSVYNIQTYIFFGGHHRNWAE